MSYPTNQKIVLDIYNNNIVYFNAKQGDTGSRYVEITCTEYGKKIVVDSSSTKAYIEYQKADGTYGLNDVTILSDGNLKVELTQNMLAVSGRCKFDIILAEAIGKIDLDKTSGKLIVTDATVISTMCFYVNVLASAIDHTMIEASNEFNAFVNAISRNIVLEKEMQENEKIRNANEETRISNETSRVNAEKSRVSAENSRKSAETSRASAETSRVTAENNRASAETLRASAETSRIEAENARVEAETTRTTSENARKTAENSRKNAETSRVTAENNRASAETSRVSAENNRATAETSRVEAENSRVNAEASRVTAENNRATAESNRVKAENSRVNAEKNRETNVQNVIDNCEDAIELANLATERANLAAENCEGIADATGVVLKSDLYDGNNLVKNTKLNTSFTQQQKKVISSGEELSIILGKIAAYMNAFDNRQQILYNVENPSAEPNNNIGNNGDIYVKVIQG